MALVNIFILYQAHQTHHNNFGFILNCSVVNIMTRIYGIYRYVQFYIYINLPILALMSIAMIK